MRRLLEGMLRCLAVAGGTIYVYDEDVRRCVTSEWDFTDPAAARQEPAVDIAHEAAVTVREIEEFLAGRSYHDVPPETP
jgi:hypothetical protein